MALSLIPIDNKGFVGFENHSMCTKRQIEVITKEKPKSSIEGVSKVATILEVKEFLFVEKDQVAFGEAKDYKIVLSMKERYTSRIYYLMTN